MFYVAIYTEYICCDLWVYLAQFELKELTSQLQQFNERLHFGSGFEIDCPSPDSLQLTPALGREHLILAMVLGNIRNSLM